MNAGIRGVVLLAVMCTQATAAGAQQHTLLTSAAGMRRAAARAGVGGVFDWIHKLSGPSFAGGGVSVFKTLEVPRADEDVPIVRLDAVTRVATSETPGDADLSMKTLQLGIEIPAYYRGVYFGLAGALHRFSGDGFESFSHWSVPITLGYHIPIRGRWALTVAGSVHYFPQFEADDFAPLAITVSRDDAEAVKQVQIRLDYNW